MTSAIGAYGSVNQNYLSSLFSKLDTNPDAGVSQSDFVSGTPSGVGSDQATSLVDQLDASNSGAPTQSDMASVFQLMSSQMQSALTNLQSTSTDDSNGANRKGALDPAQMFGKLDTNGDGKVSRDEFVNGRPQNVSSDQAGQLYDKIAASAGSSDGGTGAGDTASTSDGLTEAQLNQGVKAQHHGHHHHMQATSESSGQTPTDPTDPAALLDGLDPDSDSTSTATTTASATAASTASVTGTASASAGASDAGGTNSSGSTAANAAKTLLDQLTQAIKGYETSMLSSSYGNAASALPAMGTMSVSV